MLHHPDKTQTYCELNRHFPVITGRDYFRVLDMRKEQEKREKQPKCIEETVQGSPHILKNITIYKIPRLGEV